MATRRTTLSRRAFLAGLGTVALTASAALLPSCGNNAPGATSTRTQLSPPATPENPAETSATTASSASPTVTVVPTASRPALSGSPAPEPTVATPSSSDGVRGSTNLSADQTFRTSIQYEPTSFDFNKDVFCGGDPACFAQLLQFDPNNKVIPDIATRWESNADASVWTFTLRTDSKWSNGEAVTAHDYEYSWKRQLDPATAALYAAFLYDIKNGQAFNLKQGNFTSDDIGVKAIDDQTLQVTLQGPRVYFPVIAAYYISAPAYRQAVNQFGDSWTQPENIVCNGPFTLTEWKHNERYTLTRNEQYWNASTITLKTVQVSIISAVTEFVAYQNDELDFALHGSPGNLTMVRNDATLSKEYATYNLFGTWYLEPNVNKAPFDTKEVRLAMAHAIDRETIVKRVLNDLGTAAYTMTPPGMPGFDSNTYDEFTTYDPAAAMSLLHGTPYEGGKNWPSITLIQRNDEGDQPTSVAKALIAMLKENLGMTIELVLGDPQQVYNDAYAGKYQLMWWRWYIDYPDPNFTMYLAWYSKFRQGERNTYSNPQLDHLVTQAAAESDEAQRMSMYQQADQIIAEDAAGIFVYNPRNYALLKPWVAGMPRGSDGEKVPNGFTFTRMYDRLQILEH